MIESGAPAVPRLTAWVVLVGALAAYWIAVAAGVAGSPLATDARGAAAAAGVCLVAVSAWRPVSVEAILAAGAAVVALPAAVAATANGSALPAAALVLVAVFAVVVPSGAGAVARAVPLSGGGVILAGIAVEHIDVGTARISELGDAPALLVLIGTVLLAVAPQREVGPATVAAFALAVSAVAVPGATVVAWTLAAVAAGVAARCTPAGALAVLGLAAAAVPGGGASGLFLLSAGVLAMVLRTPWSLLAAVPGVAAFAALAVIDGPSGPELAVVAGGAAVAVAVARRLPPEPGDEQGSNFPAGEALPAAVVAAWLLVAPGTWSWVGDADLDHYGRGAAIAAATAALLLVICRLLLARRPPVAS